MSTRRWGSLGASQRPRTKKKRTDHTILKAGKKSGHFTEEELKCHLKTSKRTLSVTSSLVVQWLGLGAFTAMAWVHSLVRELRSRKARGKAKKKISQHHQQSE